MKSSKLRTNLYVACFVVVTGLACIIGLWALLLPRKALMRIILSWSYLIGFLEKHLVGLTFVVKGLENVPATPCIVAAKHQSMWETCKMFALLGDPAIVLKAELTRLPVLAWYANRSGMIPIDRKGRAKSLTLMMRAARQAVADNRKILIFPQGTRVLPFEKKPYKSGIAGIYQELQIPIVPLALNSGLYWPKGGIIKPGVIALEFLPAIPPGLSRTDMMQRLQDTLETASDRLASTGASA